MRRILTTAVASSLLALALPAAASAHHSARHDAAHHHRRHHRAHTVVFTAGSQRTVPGTTAPTTPTTPTSPEPAATITSFENGVLKLTLADGSTVSGKVTERTEIECGAANHQGDDNEGNDDNGSGDDQSGDSHDNSGPGSFSQGHGDDEQGGGDEQGSCGVSSLTPGAKVAEADLAVTSAGSFWEKIELA